MKKSEAKAIVGGLTATTKMPCDSYSLPTAACITGARMAKVKGSICASCYAMKGNYVKYAGTIQPAQYRRLASLQHPQWVDAMVTLLAGEPFFRWHDAGDLQSVDHLRQIVAVAERTPNCRHWLPTREYGMVAAFIADGGTIPENMTVRLSAMFVDQPTRTPATLQGVPGVTVSNVHAKAPAIGHSCPAPKQGGRCDACRACWNRNVAGVSYHAH